MDREYKTLRRDALEFAKKVGRNKGYVMDFAAYALRRDGVMTKEKSERLVREYVEQES